jgi:hypothetical protein
MDFSGLELGQVVGPCEIYTECSGSIKVREFLDCGRNYWLFKEGSVSRS